MWVRSWGRCVTDKNFDWWCHQSTFLRVSASSYVWVRVMCLCVVWRSKADRCFASNFLDAPVRSLVRPFNVSPVLLDYPRYLYHPEVKHQSRLSTPVLTGSSCIQGRLKTLVKLANLQRATPEKGFGDFLSVILRTANTTMHPFTLESRMFFSFSAFLLLAPWFIRDLCVSGSPSCASCGLPGMTKDAEERLMIEIAKQQLLDKLHLKERPNITQAVPRVALLTALRKLHSGRVRQDGTLELENNLKTKDKGYEIVSFADISKFGTHHVYFYSCVAHECILHATQLGHCYLTHC